MVLGRRCPPFHVPFLPSDCPCCFLTLLVTVAQQINQFCVTTVSKASLLTQGSGAEESSFLSWFAGSAVGGRDGWKGEMGELKGRMHMQFGFQSTDLGEKVHYRPVIHSLTHSLKSLILFFYHSVSHKHPLGLSLDFQVLFSNQTHLEWV